MWLVPAVALLCGVLFLKILQRYIKWILTPLRKIPGPKMDNFMFGELFVIRQEPFMQPHKRWWKQIGYDIPMLHYTSFMGGSSVIILDKDIVKEILTAPAAKNDYRFGKDGKFIANKIGDGLVSLQGAHWMRHRQIIQPAFQSNAIKEALTASVPPLVSKFVEHWRLAIDNNNNNNNNNKNKEGTPSEIDLASHLSALTLDVIGQVAFSHEFEALESVKQWAKQWANNQESSGDGSSKQLAQLDDPFVKAMLGMFKSTVLGTVIFLTGSTWADKYLNPTTRLLRRHLDDAVDAIVENARKNNYSERPKSLLQLLLQAEENNDAAGAAASSSSGGSTRSDRRLSNVELRDEMKTFIMAGHETTSTLCYWAIYALATLPDIQDRVYQEISQYAKKSGNNNKEEPLDLETVEEMEYFTAFLNEVQRMYPPVGMITRLTCFKENLAGYQIPAHTRLVISPHLLHRHPNYWKDPESFQPERWIHKDDATRKEFMELTRFAYIPFSAGGRNCIGQRFATIEAKLILVSLIRAFIFQVAPSQRDTEFAFTNIITMKTKPGLKVCVKSRE
jgi:cytochrome P450